MTGRNKTYKTAEYKQYQNDIRDSLMGTQWPFEDMQVSFLIEVGLSNRGADLDNIIKPLLDTFQCIFEKFNDNKVYHCELHKRITKKSEEYLWVRVQPYHIDLFDTEKKLVEIEPEPEIVSASVGMGISQSTLDEILDRKD